MKTEKPKGICEGCEVLAVIHKSDDEMWLCEACDPTTTLGIHFDTKTGRTYLAGLGI